MKILHVAGARPNFMKIGPVMAALGAEEGIQQQLVHTGQHYDETLSRIFFEQLGLPRPDVDLGVGSGSHAQQTARIMAAVEPVLTDYRPDLLMVVGDVNSTVAAALVAAKLGIHVAHVEAGLRSFDWSMPEEINRVVTDRLSTLLFTTERSGNENLASEGVAAERVHFVGNVMIDTLMKHRERALATGAPAALGVERGEYVLVTLHRPSNVDDVDSLALILDALAELSRERTVLFPVHPRTRARIADFGLSDRAGAVRLLDPVGYLEFLALMEGAALLLTDSGGVQEETTALGVPCLTLRPNTERPVTIEVGTNQLVELATGAILDAARGALADRRDAARLPDLWDGHAAERIAAVVRAGAWREYDPAAPGAGITLRQ